MKITNEAKVGLMITASFTIFITLVALLAQINVAQKGYKLHIYYGFLNDLRVGSPVKIGGGIKIGQVESITQSGEKTEVTVWIEKKYTLIRSTKFAIFTSGLIGEKYINAFVPPSSKVDDFFQDGDKVYGIDPASFDQMMLTFQSFMQDESGGQVLAEIMQNSKQFVENLNKISEENRYDIRKSILSFRAMVALTSRQIHSFMINLNKISKHVADLTEENKEDISVTLRNLSETSANLNKIIYRIENGKGTLGKIITDEEIYDNLRDASVSAKKLFKSLEKNPSKLFFTPEK